MFGNSVDAFDRVLESVEITLAETRGMSIVAAYEYWNGLRGSAFAPPRQAFRLEELPPRLVPYMAMVDFVGPPLDYFYRFFGTAMAEASGRELTGKTYYADNVEGYGFVNARLFPLLIERKEPLLHRTTWESVKKVQLVTTTIRLPLSSDGATVDGAVTANDYAFKKV